MTPYSHTQAHTHVHTHLFQHTRCHLVSKGLKVDMVVTNCVCVCVVCMCGVCVCVCVCVYGGTCVGGEGHTHRLRVYIKGDGQRGKKE